MILITKMLFTQPKPIPPKNFTKICLQLFLSYSVWTDKGENISFLEDVMTLVQYVVS